MSVSPSRYALLHALGVAHSGSTLLGRLLGRHPDVLYVGELLRLPDALERGLPCSCGEPLPLCPFWGPRLARLPARRGPFGRRLASTLLDLARQEDAEVVVDTSKTRAWRAARLGRDRDRAYVWIVRDTRGSLASAVRAGKRDRVVGWLRKHEKWSRRMARFVERRPGRAAVVRYEELCRDPDAVLRTLFELLGLRQVAVSGAPVDEHLVHASRSPYGRSLEAPRLDARWRRELDPELLRRAERVMARLPEQRPYLEQRAGSRVP